MCMFTIKFVHVHDQICACSRSNLCMFKHQRRVTSNLDRIVHDKAQNWYASFMLMGQCLNVRFMIRTHFCMGAAWQETILYGPTHDPYQTCPTSRQIAPNHATIKWHIAKPICWPFKKIKNALRGQPISRVTQTCERRSAPGPQSLTISC